MFLLSQLSYFHGVGQLSEKGATNFLSIVGVSVVSWSLLTVPMNPAIAFQLVWGSYNGQQRPLTSKKDTKYEYRICPEFMFRKN